MKTRIISALTGGIIATLAMTVVMFIGPFMGLPEMNTGEMLSAMIGVPVFLGWIMHFMIGVIFALSYLLLFIPLLKKVESNTAKGIIFGMAVFVFAQVMMAISGALMGGMPSPEGGMLLMMAGSLMGHIIYGIVVAIIIRENK